MTKTSDNSDEPNTPSPINFGMTDLEEALRGPGGAEIAKDLIDRFDILDEQLKSQIAAGVAPDEFAKISVIRNSFAAARHILVGFPRDQRHEGE
jgi:hypothetical protein